MLLHASRRALSACALTATLVAAGAGTPAHAIIHTSNAELRYAASSARLTLGDMNCTGSLVSPRWVLTARHCVGAGTNSAISIGPTYHAEPHTARTVIVHPHVDLALVELDRPAAAPVTPLSGEHLYPGDRAEVIGWGGIHSLLGPPVQQSPVTVQRRVTNVPSPDRGATFIEAQVDRGRIQYGDSGGPLYKNGALAGVTSMSNAGSGDTIDGVVAWYVPVAENLDWIARHAGIGVPPVAGVPAPLIDATRYPTVIPSRPAPPAPGSSASAGLPLPPGLAAVFPAGFGSS